MNGSITSLLARCNVQMYPTTHYTADTLLPLPDENLLISAAKISRYTGVANQAHNRWRHENVGPQYVRLGRRVFYRSDDVRAWIDSNYQSTTQQGHELNQLDTRLDVSKFKR